MTHFECFHCRERIVEGDRVVWLVEENPFGCSEQVLVHRDCGCTRVGEVSRLLACAVRIAAGLAELGKARAA